MIQVENLSRNYGSTRAVDNISFTVEKGEIVGFLGPNGAGKSTTMRILTGSLAATDGRAMVGGIDVFDNPRQVKQMVGYLPEVPPLYTDMTVRDYLTFCARIKGSTRVRDSVEQQIERVGLKEVAHRLIDHLSKGYRQRVGIAQALVHDPQVLILDEPASGLDPGQRKEIRDLVRELAEGDVTVILSTHVLPEVEAVCDRVIIINKGVIVAQDSVAALADTGNLVKARVAEGDEAAIQGVLMGIEGVLSAELDQGLWMVEAGEDVRRQIAAALVPYGLLELSSQRRLEDVFLRLTGTDT